MERGGVFSGGRGSSERCARSMWRSVISPVSFSPSRRRLSMNAATVAHSFSAPSETPKILTFSRLDRLSNSISLSSSCMFSFNMSVRTSSVFRVLSSSFAIRYSASLRLLFTLAISSFIIPSSLFSFRNPFSSSRINSRSPIAAALLVLARLLVVRFSLTFTTVPSCLVVQWQKHTDIQPNVSPHVFVAYSLNKLLRFQGDSHEITLVLSGALSPRCHCHDVPTGSQHYQF
ncbi:hypothetical protein ILYODFUR_023961 [Ilyodon furcidens]|uniref:Uncharacterized protein n=1 Tax=Ilyodon furcidens TaxID=33524 RepID=A0ABV0U8L2_9TELE